MKKDFCLPEWAYTNMTNGGPATATIEQIIPDKQLKSEGDVFLFHSNWWNKSRSAFSLSGKERQTGTELSIIHGYWMSSCLEGGIMTF